MKRLTLLLLAIMLQFSCSSSNSYQKARSWEDYELHEMHSYYLGNAYMKIDAVDFTLSDEQISVKLAIRDKETGEPIDSIFLINHSNSLDTMALSSLEGNYEFSIPLFSDGDTIGIHSLSYVSRYYSFNQSSVSK